MEDKNSVVKTWQDPHTMDSQQLWWDAQELQEIRPVYTLERKEGLECPQPHWGAIESWWLLGEGETEFLKGVLPGYTFMDDPHLGV